MSRSGRGLRATFLVAVALHVFAPAFATLFGQLSRCRYSKVAMSVRTPGNQPQDELDYPEFKPTGNYMLETPFFNMEKFRKDESLGLAAVFGAFIVLAIIAGQIASSSRQDIDLSGAQPKEEARVAKTESTNQGVNSLGKPIRVITN
ncbi:unnamed protein product [Effrenium voratum]|nr:unnamed protein product [Effrenium voratum]